ncbi:angiogenic factor with G patch and FHA domains 1 [Rhodnius prolixus]|uniref:FHA domain-containing protein n=2 Tax=Rhodnius TaxID=13248 RepID=T1HAE6_RHOPR
MDSIISNVENKITKDLIEKIVTLFNELQEKDRPLAVLLVEYLIKHLGYESENVNVTIRSTISTSTICTQTDINESHNGWDMKDITNEVKEVAEQCMNETGLNYDKTSGTYYNSEEGYYYIPDYRLYYYPTLGAYYYYDETSDSLKFHSSVAPENSVTMAPDHAQSSSCNNNKSVSHIKETTNHKEKVKSRKDTSGDKEEGELSSSDDADLEEDSHSQVIIESGPKAFEPDHSKHNAPCMRIVIVKTALENYHAGTLFLVTRDGGTLGREGVHHEILLPDCNVSKDHLKFRYAYKGDTEQRYAYEVIDLGSRNGTWVNGKRLSGSNEMSKPEEIHHGTVITVGSTTLLCHIHKGLDSCSECQSVETPLVRQCPSAESNLSSKQLHHKQVMQMKHKYQLNNAVEDDSLPKGYVDRAKARRAAVGSSHDSEKTETSSVHVPMSKSNKGYDLLSKMGWKEGNNLGKNASSSVQEPLYVEPKVGKAGFGAL